MPEIEGILYSKEGYKKPWKKFFFILRSSGLYYSTKGKSKVITLLVKADCYCVTVLSCQRICECLCSLKDMRYTMVLG